MLIEKIDTVGGKAAKRTLDGVTDVLRPAVQARHPPVLDLEAELGCDDHPLALTRKRAGEELLVGVWAVYFCRVEKRHAKLDGPVNGGDGLAFVSLLGGTVGLAHPHQAEPHRRDFQAARSEFALLHECLLEVRRVH